MTSGFNASGVAAFSPVSERTIRSLMREVFARRSQRIRIGAAAASSNCGA
jgi:hypothetical protein